MATTSFNVVVKDVQAVVTTLRQQAAAHNANFDGDIRSGDITEMGAEVAYVVTYPGTFKGNQVDITIEDSILSRLLGWDVTRLEKEARDWLAPYIVP